MADHETSLPASLLYRVSQNFMHFNFRSKLYFYMKFPEDVYFSIEYNVIQNFSKCHALFAFLTHSTAVAAWCGI